MFQTGEGRFDTDCCSESLVGAGRVLIRGRLSGWAR